MFEENNKEFVILPNNFRYWAADPFPYTIDDKTFLFFEMFDRIKGKGVIGYRVLEDGKVGKMKKIYLTGVNLKSKPLFTGGLTVS